MRDPVGRWMHGVSRPVEQDPFQGDTYVQRASATRRREYPGEDDDNDGSRRSHRDWRPPDRGRYPNQGGRPPDQGGYCDGGNPGDRGPLEEDILIGMETPWKRRIPWWRTS